MTDRAPALRVTITRAHVDLAGECQCGSMLAPSYGVVRDDETHEHAVTLVCRECVFGELADAFAVAPPPSAAVDRIARALLTPVLAHARYCAQRMLDTATSDLGKRWLAAQREPITRDETEGFMLLLTSLLSRPTTILQVLADARPELRNYWLAELRVALRELAPRDTTAAADTHAAEE